MYMVRVSFLIFGYRKISVLPENTSAVISRLLKNKISFTTAGDGVFYIAERDISATRKALSKDIEYEESEPLGFFGAIMRIRQKKGLAVGLAISLMLLIFSENLVWDIRVEGNERLSRASVVEALSECGFSVGDFWPTVKRSVVEGEVLSKFPDISWININRRGSVAYIVLSEREDVEKEDGKIQKSGYSNIVATADCVIEEITVKRGVAEVKPGDVVRAGDILISGILPDTAGGGFCRAEGVVIGRCFERVESVTERKYKKVSEISETAVSATLKIFNLPINIFKRYGNSYDGCDIIKNVKVFSLFDKAKLPIFLTTEYARSYVYQEAEYSDDELVSVASRELRAKTAARLDKSDLIKIKTFGEFTDTGYKICSEIVFLSDVGKTLEFTLD